MKKTLFKIIALVSTLSLSACDFLSFLRPHVDDNPTDHETPYVKPTEVNVVDNNEHHIGDTYSTEGIVVTATYSDNTQKTVELSNVQVDKIKNPQNKTIDKNSALDRAGTYRVDFRVNLKGTIFMPNITFDVATGFATSGFVFQSVEYANTLTFCQGEVVRNRLSNIDLLLHWNHGDEYYNYNINTDTTGISFSLRKQGDSTTEYINTALEKDESYNLILTYQSYSYTYAFVARANYYRLNSEDIINTCTDFDDSIAPSKGNVKMLVIPITLSGSYTDTWTTDRLGEIDGYYFGTDTNKMSLKSYYETASFGQMNVSGSVVAPYVETSSSLTSQAIQSDESMAKLFTLISNAVNYVKTSHPEINLDDYDLNDDGAIDNIHMITNFNTNTYREATGESPWNTPLWPHKYATGDIGTKSSPEANVYSISAIDHVYDCVTAIHEQGHIFGLDDYYDYAQTDIDYVGYADMQSGNLFDWNSYSKFSCGWISPYVVTGPTEITIQAASLNGDCIVIPANPETFNNSAFDEYFLIELFSPYGNNIVNYPVNGVYQGSTWEYYSSRYNLGGYGVRFYHVNAQQYRYTSGGFVEINEHITSPGYYYRCADNNAYDYERRSSYFEDYADFKHLAIVQRGGNDTFGSTSPGARHYLTSADLFHQGDVFTFNQYKQFLTKTNAIPTTMNNGETFPYKITFTAMSATQTTVKVELL